MVISNSQQALIDEAAKRGFRYEIIGTHKSILKIITSSGASEIFVGYRPMSSSANGTRISINKPLTLAFVENCGYVVPAYELVDSAKSAMKFQEAHGAIVIKPIDGHDSAGVTANITESSDVAAAFETAKSVSPTANVIAQAFLGGKLYRLLVMNGRLVAVAERRAARVIGDGVSTLEQLIDILNAQPHRNIAGQSPLVRVKHSNVTEYLGSHSLIKIPPEGEVVRLTEIESVDRGGDAINVTNSVHPSWRQAVEEVAKSIGLPLAGFDIITDDVAQPMLQNYLPLLEINAAPGYKLHERPSVGEPINLAEIALENLT